MDQIKLTNLYEKIIDGQSLTLEVLEECGFNDVDILEAVREKIWEKNASGYDFLDVQGLHAFGVKLEEQGLEKRAALCYDKCSNIFYDRVHKSVMDNEFVVAVDLILEFLLDEDCSFATQLLFMIHYVGVLSDDLKSKVIKLVNERKRTRDLSLLEKSIYAYKFAYAKRLNYLVEKKGSSKKAIYLTLLNSCIKRSKAFQKKIVELANARKLGLLQRELEKEQRLRGLNTMDVHILMVLQDLEEFRRNKEIPEVMEDETVTNVFAAIEVRNYEKALVLLKEFTNLNGASDLSLVLKMVLEVMIQQLAVSNLNQIPMEPSNDEQDPGVILDMNSIINVLLSGQVSFLEAQEQFGLNMEQLCVVKLVFAKNYYRICMDLLGDRLVQEVRDVGANSQCVRKMLDEASIARDMGMYDDGTSLGQRLKRINPQVLFRK